jgi:hypothetical protein
MPSLRELQQRFVADLSGGGASAPASIGASGAGAGERMAVYARTIRSNYRNAMSATYPSVRRIVGTTFFNAAVDAYVEANPSRSGDLNEYGDAFGDFLCRYDRAAELPYLPDVARLEWAIDEASRAADSAFAGDAVLAALSRAGADALPGLRLGLEPSCRLIASAFPLFRIWQVNQPGYDGELQVDFTAGPHHLRIRRETTGASPEGAAPSGIAVERIDAGRFEWLSALAHGATLARALERALAADSAFDLQAALQQFIGDGSIDRIGEHADARVEPAAMTPVTVLCASRD